MCDVVVIFSAITGFHYNLENIIIGIWNANSKGKSKMYAVCCTIPYIQFFLMIWFSSYSQWWDKYPLMFLLSAGMHLTWVNAIFNLCSTSGMTFDWMFYEPFAFLSIIAAEVHGYIDG